ncbi:DUF3566 domain-containing protein [Streptosporangium sp. NPDC049304]|uniref:DUF3566 domain-containing protein n=1 Tax=Streptosporangium sp. NPDC049304 TaxID=3154830 RepID=UPI00341E90F0
MDKIAGTKDAEAASSPVNGSVPAPETDGSVSDNRKGRPKVTTTEDGKQADTTVRIRPSGSPPPSAPPPQSPTPPQGGQQGRSPSASPSPGGQQGRSPSAPTTPPAGGQQGRSPSAPSPGQQSRPSAGQQNNRASWSPGSLSSPQAPADATDRKAADVGGPRSPRKAHLVLRRIEPWSAMKFSFVVSLVCFVVLFIAVAALYMVLSSLGVFENIIQTVTQLTTADGNSTNGVDIASWFEPVRILGYTALIGAVNVVLITALATLGAVIYNIASDLVGGVEVTFSEAE